MDALICASSAVVSDRPVVGLVPLVSNTLPPVVNGASTKVPPGMETTGGVLVVSSDSRSVTTVALRPADSIRPPSPPSLLFWMASGVLLTTSRSPDVTSSGAKTPSALIALPRDGSDTDAAVP